MSQTCTHRYTHTYTLNTKCHSVSWPFFSFGHLKYTTMRGIPVYYEIKLNSMKLHGDHGHCLEKREEKRREEKRREEKRREEKRREEKRREEKRREEKRREEKRREEKRREEKRREEKYIQQFFTMTVTKDLGCNGIPAVFSKESRNCVGNPLKKKKRLRLQDFKKFTEMKMQK